MDEQQIMDSALRETQCPHCETMGSMKLTGGHHDDLWDWKCNICDNGGNVGYDLHEIPYVDLPPDKEEEFRNLQGGYSDFLRRWGVYRPKTRILLNQDPSLY